MAALLWFVLTMALPSAVFMLGGFWVVRRRYGAAWHVLGIVAIVVGVLLAAATTFVALPGIAVTTKFEDGMRVRLKSVVAFSSVGYPICLDRHPFESGRC